MTIGSVILHGLGVEGRAAKRYFEVHTDLTVRVHDPNVAESEPADRIERDLGPDVLYLRSPGVAPIDPIHQAARRAGAVVTTPTGYWISTLAPPALITITGTKGKSTTTALLAAILREGGVASAPYGNIGRPVLDAQLPGETVPVVELSSYMMHDLLPAKEHRWQHVLTTLFKEHTDWHGGERFYREAKLRPYRWTPPCPGLAPSAVIEAEALGEDVRAIEAVIPRQGDSLVIGGTSLSFDDFGEQVSSPGVQGAVRTAAAAALPILGHTRTVSALEAALSTWTGLPSRQARVSSADGRIWIDDALATVPEATLQALRRFSGGPVSLVLGGKDRGQDYGALAEEVARMGTVRVFGFGEVAGKLGRMDWPVFDTMEAAVAAAREACPRGGVVLFSPAAPSGAPHASYAERAALFARLASEG